MRSIRDQRIGFILRCFVLPALFVAPTIYMLIFLWSGSQGLPFPQRAKSVPFSAGHILGGFLRAVSQDGGAPNSKLGVEEWRFSSIFITTNDRRLLICHGSHWQTIFLYHFPVLIKIHALFFFFLPNLFSLCVALLATTMDAHEERYYCQDEKEFAFLHLFRAFI